MTSELLLGMSGFCPCIWLHLLASDALFIHLCQFSLNPFSALYQHASSAMLNGGHIWIHCDLALAWHTLCPVKWLGEYSLHRVDVIWCFMMLPRPPHQLKVHWSLLVGIVWVDGSLGSFCHLSGLLCVLNVILYFSVDGFVRLGSSWYGCFKDHYLLMMHYTSFASPCSICWNWNAFKTFVRYVSPCSCQWFLLWSWNRMVFSSGGDCMYLTHSFIVTFDF